MEYLLDAAVDTIKILPFLYLAYLIIEYLEHRASEKFLNWLKKPRKTQPLIAAITGLIPSCGMPGSATTLYAAGLINFGTLLAIYLASCDEAYIYILVSGNLALLAHILVTMFVIALLAAWLFLRLLPTLITNSVAESEDHEHCVENIYLAALKRCLNTGIVLVIVNLLLNILISSENITFLESLIASVGPFQSLLTALIGLIPNCAISILFPKLYFSKLIGFPSLIAGLLASTGTSLILLFKSPLKMTLKLKVVCVLYLIAAGSGLLLSFFTFL